MPISPLTIVVIDDFRASREMVVLAARLLERELKQPVLVSEAASGIEGLDLLRARRDDLPLLVILDVHLPGLDIDGRALGALLREEFPDLPLLPFTADRRDQTREDLAALGMLEPVYKPVSAEKLAKRMRKALNEHGPAAGPLHAFVAAQARQLDVLVRASPIEQGVRLAVFARAHLTRAGLERLLSEAQSSAPFTVALVAGQRDLVLNAIYRSAVSVLLAAPDVLDQAREIAISTGVPLLVYASAHDAAPLYRDETTSVVVGPTDAAELALAIRALADGRRYVNSAVQELLSLSRRQQDIVALLARGITTEQIVRKLGISESRFNHLITELYDVLDIPRSRAALVGWAQRAPLSLLDEPR
ncbi:MAG: response regulator [Roseiflexaceae bacterium]|nr:response regulator [Roseiflexaceae bacterium]